MKKIPLYVYVAQNNPKGAEKVITGFNLRQPRNRDDLFRGLRHVIITQGEEGLMSIARHHPDRELILSSEPEQAVIIQEESKSGCDGNCSCGNHSNIEGDEKPSREEVNKAIEDKLKAKDEKITRQDITEEVKKAFGETKNYIQNNLTTIAIAGIVGFLLYKGLKGK